MVDTARKILTGCVLRDDCPFPVGIYKEKVRVPGGASTEVEKGIKVCDAQTGLAVWGSPQNGFSIEHSLPQLIFPTNGRLLKSQAELDGAVGVMDAFLAKVLSPPRTAEFTRVDLCWQIAGDIAHFIASLRGCRHPLINGVPGFAENESIWFGKRNATMRGCIYDKMRELSGKPGNVIRIEWRLRKRRLREELTGSLAPVTHLIFDACRRSFRRLTVALSPNPAALIQQGSGALADFIALGEMRGWKDNGRSCLEIWSQHYGSPQAAARFRQKVKAAKVRFGGVNFHELLPESHMPDPVEI